MTPEHVNHIMMLVEKYGSLCAEEAGRRMIAQLPRRLQKENVLLGAVVNDRQILEDQIRAILNEHVR